MGKTSLMIDFRIEVITFVDDIRFSAGDVV